ncbi:MAG: polysaccharide deacetylase family protein [Runella sp.]
MSFKHFVRDSWLTASYYSGLSHLYHTLAGRRRGIISYHNVLPIETLPVFDTYNVDQTAVVFDKQLAFLKKHFRFLPIEELDSSKKAGFFLTVDDGMLNNYQILAPILEKHQLNALFAICPAFVDAQLPHIWRDHLFLLFRENKNIFWLPDHISPSLPLNQLTRSLKKYIYDNQIADIYGFVKELCQKNNWPYEALPFEPLRYKFMSWEQILDLQRRGHRIASHTMTHRILRFLNNEEKRYELSASKSRLEEKLKTTIDILVYPYGSINEIDQATVNMAEETGYKTALMNVQTHTFDNLAFAQPRFALPPTTHKAHLHAIGSGFKFLFR